MDLQSVNDQLELLRLKEMFMSNIDIRSKMATLICRESPYREFCELTHCEQRHAKMFSQMLLFDIILTPEEIFAERERLERIKKSL